MLTQIKILTKLELRNMYGLNVFRFSRDKQAKRKTKALMITWCVLIAMLFLYVGGLSYGLIMLGVADSIPAYLITISSLFIFFFGIFKAGSVIFHKNGYDILCSLPVTQTAIVASRFLRMYVENLAMTVAVLFPGLTVYAWFRKPGASFYLLGVGGALFVPLLPAAFAALIGALVAGLSSRMKHKSLVETGLIIVVVLVIMLGSSGLSAMEGNISPEIFMELTDMVTMLLEKLYPPAMWLGRAVVNSSVGYWLMFAGISCIAFGAVAAVVGINFQSICHRLYSTTAKHNYKMQKLQVNNVLAALCKKEFKRYFASSVYVTNTIIGPIMGVVFSSAVLFVGEAGMKEFLELPVDIGGFVPFVVAGIMCLMTTTATSISMEGKNWWIVKSLPLTAKAVLDAKILMNLVLILPFYLVSEVLLIIALKPNILEAFWLLAIPACLNLFSCVYGITVNLYFPVMNWESEISVVKQSASSLVGGMGGFAAAILCILLTVLMPESYLNFVKFGICVLLLAITALLYKKNNQKDLCTY